MQIAMACITYEESNGDFFPAQSQYTSGATDVFLPMPSLAILYPGYIDNLRVFRCPETKDRPVVTVTWPSVGNASRRIRHIDFGPVAGYEKCSYFYDERTHFRTVGPSQAVACDADGMCQWDIPQQPTPQYAANWTRKPRKPNHKNGMNVMYFDGHVRWSSSPYASDEPKDNIFCPNGGSADGSGQWGADTDAYLWDGVNARAPQTDVE